MSFSFSVALLSWITTVSLAMAVEAPSANHSSKEIIPGIPGPPSFEPLERWSLPAEVVDQDVLTNGRVTRHGDADQNENEASGQQGESRRAASTFQLGLTFQGLSYADNANLNNGNTLVPPDPICAASKTTLVAAANSILEIRNKQGGLLYKDALDQFFVNLGPSGLLYDPKVVYDQYADRFVMVVLDQVSPGGLGPVSDSNMPQQRFIQSTNVTGNSTILLAVSTSGSPAGVGDWYFQAINALEIDATDSYWADYPGTARSRYCLSCLMLLTQLACTLS